MSDNQSDNSSWSDYTVYPNHLHAMHRRSEEIQKESWLNLKTDPKVLDKIERAVEQSRPMFTRETDTKYNAEHALRELPDFGTIKVVKLTPNTFKLMDSAVSYWVFNSYGVGIDVPTGINILHLPKGLQDVDQYLESGMFNNAVIYVIGRAEDVFRLQQRFPNLDITLLFV